MTQKRDRIGQYVRSSAIAGETYQAYIPNPLPPSPELEMVKLYPLLEEANMALGRLDGVSMILPDPLLFLDMYVRKEAILSSQIEGTQSSLSDMLFFESTQISKFPIDDVREVSCYVSAMDYGLKRLKTLPLSLRLLREIHAQLMDNARGRHSNPGEFRRSQNWIGGSSPQNAFFVPPPPSRLIECLDHFEKFLHDKTIKLPVLIKAALAHVQFETIHPFLDGNGRVGRLLITLILCHEGVLQKPLLYLSLYFKLHQQAYYEGLDTTRKTGDFEKWIAFFLQGIIETSNQAIQTAQNIIQLCDKDQECIKTSGHSAKGILTIYTYLQRHPICMTKSIRKQTKLSQPTVIRSLAVLQSLGIVKEVTGKDRHKIFVYKKYLDLLNQHT